ncbi:MAG: cbb3-type cytochrome c oxidase subunit II [Planctomycetota bacterium]|jgi:cytochrome c oxidase cbb3-type subunit 2
MNTAIRLFAGTFATFAAAWIGIVLVPHLQLKDLQSQKDEALGTLNPAPYTGIESDGRDVYIDLGCTYCHSQQVRGGFYNADLKRGWGVRRSHPLDYIYDEPQLLGTMRTGPDLANIGSRQPSEEWHYLHLYDPQITSRDSIMPPHRFLFEKRRITGQRSADALPLKDEFAVEDGYEVVPTYDAKALVAYLKRLDQSYEIKSKAE